MPKQKRLFFIDNIRILLTVLVILHHVAITYGAPGGWYYQNEQTPGIASQFLLTLFVAVNQAFFMGFFFLIAAYFTPGAYDRKGTGRFLKDRFLRLGLPLAVYIVFLHPLTLYARVVGLDALNPSRAIPEFAKILPRFFKYIIGVGPLWFVEALLIFGLVYSGYRWLAKLRKPGFSHVGRPPTHFQVAGLAALLGLVSFVVRIWLPIGWSLAPLNLQLAFFPQYIALFVVGLVAYRYDWFSSMPEAMGRWGWVILLCTVVLFPTLFAFGGALDGVVAPFMGGLHWQSLAYALWEQTVGIGIIVGLIVLFRRNFNTQGRFAQALSRSTYTVYIIHAPVVVLLAVMMAPVGLPPLVKFVLTGTLSVGLCFLMGNIVCRLPIARQIL